MAVTTKKSFTATTNSTTTAFSPVGIELNNANDLDVYVTLSGGTRVLQYNQSTGSTTDSNHPQVNDTTGLYFPAVASGTTLYNYTLSSDNNTITFNSALPSGAVVSIERRTRDGSGDYTAFTGGSTIRSTDLNKAFDESNFTGQEARNKAFDLENQLGIKGTGIPNSLIGPNAIASSNIIDGTIATGDLANDSVTVDKIADAQLKDLANTLSASAAELNQLDNKTITGTFVGSNSNDIPTSSAINSHFINLLDSLGGFVAIANEVSFPNSNPDPSDDAGTAVSISDAGGVVINTSGVSTTGRTVGGATVTITGFPSGLQDQTLAAGLGLIVQTTGTANTYTYHKLIGKEDDMITISDSVSSFANRYRIGTSDPSTDNDEGDLFFNTSDDLLKVWKIVSGTGSWQATVPTQAQLNDIGIIASNTTWASDCGLITQSVDTASGSGNIETVADNISNVNTTAGAISNVNTVAGSISNVNTVAGSIGNVNRYANEYTIASSAPGSPSEGDLWYDSTNNLLKYYTGSAWEGVDSSDNNTTYTISCVDGDNSDEEKIRLTAGGSGSGTDDVVLEAGTGLSVARSGDKITFTNTVTNTDTQLTTEQVQDIVGAMFTGNTETRITVTYEDSDGTIDLVVDDQSSDNNTTYAISCVDGDNSDEEKIRLTAGGSGSGTDDIVLEAGTGLSVARSGDKITFTNTVTDTTLTNEAVQDVVGAMFSSNTETGITATYQDSDGTIDLVVGTLNQNTTGTAAGLTGTPNITVGDVVASSLDISGNADIDGTLEADAITVNGTALAASATTDTTNASNISSGTLAAARVATLNQNTSGTSAGLTGTPNITVGDVVAASLDISGNADIDGTLEADAYTVDGTALNEYIADTVGAMVSSNTETGISVSYEDSDNTLDFVIGTLNQNTTGTAGGLTGTPNITVGDVVAASLDISGNADIDGTLEADAITLNGTSLAASATTDTTNASNISSGTLAAARVATLNQNTSGTSAGLTGTPNITVGDVVAASLDISGNVDVDGTLETDALTIDGTSLAETIADTVGSMVSSNTETGISVTYEDSDNTLDFVIGTLNQNTTGSAATLGTARNFSLTGEVTASDTSFNGSADCDIATTIANNVVDEDNLKISNTGSDGEFLQKQSGNTGGLTWAAVSQTDTTYAISCVDGDNSDEEKIRLTAGGSGSGTDDIVLEAGTGLSIARSGDKITFTNTVADTTLNLIDEDDMSTDSATRPPSQQSVKAYVDANTGGTVTSFSVSANNSTDETVYPLFVDGATGTQAPETDTGLTYNPSTGVLTTTQVTGNLTGTVTGTATGLAGTPNITVGDVVAASLDISGNADIDGTMEADAYTVDGTALNEYIADTVGAMVGSNTESGITVAYQDADNTLDFTVGTLNQDTTGTAAIATTITVADESSDTSCNVLYTTAATGNLGAKSGTNLTFNSSSGDLTATLLNGGAGSNLDLDFGSVA